jgi:hypothetical protein
LDRDLEEVAEFVVTGSLDFQSEADDLGHAAGLGLHRRGPEGKGPFGIAYQLVGVLPVAVLHGNQFSVLVKANLAGRKRRKIDPTENPAQDGGNIENRFVCGQVLPAGSALRTGAAVVVYFDNAFVNQYGNVCLPLLGLQGLKLNAGNAPVRKNIVGGYPVKDVTGDIQAVMRIASHILIFPLYRVANSFYLIMDVIFHYIVYFVIHNRLQCLYIEYNTFYLNIQ